MENAGCPMLPKTIIWRTNSEETRWLLLMDCDLNDWWKGILKDHGLDFEKDSQYKYQTLEELKNIKLCFNEMGLDESSDLVKEVNEEINQRV